MDRRRFVAASGAAAAFSILPSAGFAQGASGDGAKAALDDRFDVKQFHEVLKEGSMPLTILEKRIAERTRVALRI